MTLTLQVDPIACTGHGMCADLLPELIELDEWGYPILADSVPPDLAAHARRAVNACPALALRLVRTQNQLVTRHQLATRRRPSAR
ncbi:MAG TPA: ferredoxin [Streptosporangiaceae bacterium]|nr:ferredoxin [Streptosporangiaceae bacterium]